MAITASIAPPFAPTFRQRAEKGADAQALGRPRGGRGIKAHLMVDALGRVLAFALTPGQKGNGIRRSSR